MRTKVLIFICSAMFCVSMLLPVGAQEQGKKVAVVLSGGGAKGVAHIGALKVIEKAGIPVDIVTGTSMGSIVGGLYSIGYNAAQLDSIVRAQDWAFLLSDNENLRTQSLDARKKANTYFFNRSIVFESEKISLSQGFIKGKNIAALFRSLTAGYRDSIDFSSLPRKFVCVATDIVTNTEYDFHSGILAEAMRASMSIPAVFAPVRKGDMVLVDGGLRNNYPADIAKSMGADYIIGVTVQGPPKTADDLTSTMALMGQIVDVNCKLKYDENLSITDIPIRVNTQPYGTASFTKEAIDSLIRRGEEEAMKHWDELLALKKRLGMTDDIMAQSIDKNNMEAVDKEINVSKFMFANMSERDEKFLRLKFNLTDSMGINRETAEQILTSLNQDLFYYDMSYKYEKVGDGSYIMTFDAGRKKTAQVNLGARFDTEEMAALQINAEMPLHTSSPFNFDVTIRLGKRIKTGLEMVFYPISTSKVKLAYEYNNIDINVYEKGKRSYNNVFGHHLADLTFLDFNVRNFNVKIDAQWNYYHHGDLLSIRKHNDDTGTVTINNAHFYSYHAVVRYDSENDWYFPTRGVHMNAGFGYYTDNLVGYKSHEGFSIADASWRMSFPVTENFSLQPMCYGRFLFGQDIPYIMKNLLGGNFFGHYMSQQMPFAGIGNVEIIDNQFLALQMRAQEHLFKGIYLVGKVGVAQYSDKLDGLLNGNTLWGLQVGGYYKSILGPLGANIGWSNRTENPFFYINLGYEF
jgi:NTE family protein